MAKWMTILGGARSGKTDLAAQMCRHFGKVAWWGTALQQPQDPLWEERLQALKSSRDPNWTTFDGPWSWPADAAGVLPQTTGCDLFVMDCLNLWLAAHIQRGASRYSLSQLRVHLEIEFSQLTAALLAQSCPVLLVSAEVGWGVVPAGEVGRLFRDLLSDWNRQIVGQSDFGVTMQAGRAFVWPAGKTSLPPEGVEVRCVDERHLSRLLSAG
ncbi:MAG: hypothetical protein RL189_3195 [Pseudomonadota bacterium]